MILCKIKSDSEFIYFNAQLSLEAIWVQMQMKENTQVLFKFQNKEKILRGIYIIGIMNANGS